MAESSERFVVTLVATRGDDRPAIVRLRGMLKFALRAMNLRCVSIGTDQPAAGQGLNPAETAQNCGESG